MLFNSITFLIFFVVVTSLYFAIPYSKRWILLLISSCYFYMAFVPIYILILFSTILIDYFAGIVIENSQGKKRKSFLVVSLIANIGVLAVFKYYNFFIENTNGFIHNIGLENSLPYLNIILPIGLSFHTFQAMSYTIEVYRGNQKAERHLGIYSLYVMFYPQLVAGPIERPQNLLPQFREDHKFDYERVTDGLKLMAWGLFKKVVIADRLTIVVDTVYGDPNSYNSLSLIIATVFFTFQIFCDFSGYSDMAIGAAKVMGFKLMTNFNKPYHARSISEFWKRWHISLSTWFKDYLYISLGGNRVTIPRWYLNLFIVFLVSGLWHGASWTFVLWGAIHGFYIVFEHLTKNIRDQISKKVFPKQFEVVSIITTFSLVSFAWIFFRAESLNSSLYIAKHIFSGIPDLFSDLINHNSVIQKMGANKKELLLSFSVIIFLIFIEFIDHRNNILIYLKQKPAFLRWALYYGIVLVILFLGVFENRSFIYFQFLKVLLHRKFLNKILLLTLPFVFFYGYVEMALNKIPTSYSILKTNFHHRKKNIEVLFIGDSQSQLGVSPSVLTKYNSYNLSNVSQSIYTSCKLVEQNLDSLEKLKLVVLSVSPIMLFLSDKGTSEQWREKFYYHYWDLDPEITEPNFFWKLKIGIYDSKTILSYCLKGFKNVASPYINNLDTLGWEKGYYPNSMQILNSTCAKEVFKYHITSVDQKNTKNALYICELNRVLAKKNIRLILIEPPVTKYYYDELPYKLKNESELILQKLKSSESIQYYDFQTDTQFIDSHFRDVNHLNYIGAEKFSNQLYKITQTYLN